MPFSVENTFTKTIHISAPPAKIFTFLADPTNAVGLQPLVVEVIELERGTNARGLPTCRYQSVEKLRLLGFIPYFNRIDVLMTLVKPNQTITNEVHSPARVYLHSTYQLDATTVGTQVTETILIRCPALLARYVVATANRAHSQLMLNLQTVIENGRFH